MNTPHTMPGPRRLWWGVAASPVAWALTELLGYPMVARSCESAAGADGMRGLAHPAVWMVGLTVLFAAVAASGVWVAWRNVRATARPVAGAAVTSLPAVVEGRGARPGRAHFMAVAGVFVSSIFLVGTLLYALPSLILNLCAQVR
jgi:hypothetical protein